MLVYLSLLWWFDPLPWHVFQPNALRLRWSSTFISFSRSNVVLIQRNTYYEMNWLKSPQVKISICPIFWVSEQIRPNYQQHSHEPWVYFIFSANSLQADTTAVTQAACIRLLVLLTHILLCLSTGSLLHILTLSHSHAFSLPSKTTGWSAGPQTVLLFHFNQPHLF